MLISVADVEISKEFPQKAKTRATIWPRHTSPLEDSDLEESKHSREPGTPMWNTAQTGTTDRFCTGLLAHQLMGNVTHNTQWHSYIHNECNCVICRKVDRTRDHDVKQSKPDSERQIPKLSVGAGMAELRRLIQEDYCKGNLGYKTNPTRKLQRLAKWLSGQQHVNSCCWKPKFGSQTTYQVAQNCP